MNHVKAQLIVYLLFSFLTPIIAQNLQVKSPDQTIEIKITVDDKIQWSVYQNGDTVILPSPISLTLENNLVLGLNPRLIDSKTKSVDEDIFPVVPVKSKVIRDNYNELTLKFNKNFSLQFRVYNDGAAYRFITSGGGGIRVLNEQVQFNFAEDHKIFFPQEEKLISHYERTYLHKILSEIEPGEFSSLPALVSFGKGTKILITEADLYDYPAMFLSGSAAASLSGLFPKYVIKAEPKNDSDRNEIITQEAEYIAAVEGARTFPWRVLIITKKDKQLIESQLVFQLSRSLVLKETDWIKPGKVAWDWWNALNIYGVDFKSGLNTDTYKYYIDFASKYGIEYIILDEGWSKSTKELVEGNPNLNIEELMRYAENKNVGIILWVLWKPLDNNLDVHLDKFAEWGAKGIKVDFMQRADQFMVNYYEKIVREAAKRKLTVDFHGAFKPAGLRRAYPNLLSYEGVKGLEWNKWSDNVTPEHNLTLPFIRMVAGPMDYTPGAMLNSNEDKFYINFDRPMSRGTRCHQIAMYVIFESPLQMLADSPTNYLKENECTEFIAQIPTTWDETKVLEASVSDYLVVARKKGDTWYIGAMTDWNERDFTIDLSFLDDGNYIAEIMHDGINVDKFASDYKRAIKQVSGKDKLAIKLAKGGGWAAIINKK